MRIDTLTLVLLPLLVWGTLVATMRRAPHPGRVLGGAALGFVALAALDLRLVALALIGVAWLSGATWWSRAAGVVQAAALLALGGAAHVWRWNDVALGAAFGGIVVGLLLVGAVLALDLLPLNIKQPRVPTGIAALCGLYPLLRMVEVGPLDWRWAVVMALVGAGGAVAVAVAVLRPVAEIDRARAVVVATWLAALAPIGLATEAGVGASLVLLLAAIWLDSIRQINPWAGVPLVGVGLWLAAAAGLAGGVPLLAALFGALALLLIWMLAHLSRPFDWRGGLALLVGLALALAVPKMFVQFGRSLGTQLGAGLTPFGRISAASWSGLSVQNAGSQTVATLPLLVVAGVLLVVAAVVYGGLRIVGRDQPLTPTAGRLKDATLWALVGRHLPTARRPRRTAEQPDDL